MLYYSEQSLMPSVTTFISCNTEPFDSTQGRNLAGSDFDILMAGERGQRQRYKTRLTSDIASYLPETDQLRPCVTIITNYSILHRSAKTS